MSRLFVGIVKPFMEFEHVTFRVVEAKLLFDPGNRFFGASHAFIQPNGELAGVGARSARVCCRYIIEDGQSFDAARGEDHDPSFDRFGMEMQDGTGLVGPTTIVEQGHGVEPFGDAAITGLFVAPPQVATL